MVELGLPLTSNQQPDDDFWLPEAFRDQSIADSYIIGEVIGRGYTSTVYKGLYKGKTECACKVMRKSHLSRKRVQAVVEEMMKLRHRNLAKLRGAFETKYELTVVMDLVAGGELLEHFADHAGYSERVVASGVRQVLSALEVLHSAGIWHGAVRPEKLLFADVDLEPDEEPVLALGSVALGPPAAAHSSFCAPELRRGKEMHGSAAGDMWGIGVVTYIMLCGFEPFGSYPGGSPSGSQPPPPPPPPQGVSDSILTFPSPWWDDVSGSAKDFLSQVLHTDPPERMTVRKALDHPWVTGDEAHSAQLVAAAKRLREFNARRKFRAATQAVVATQRLVSPDKRLSRILGHTSPESHSPENEAAKPITSTFDGQPEPLQT